MNIKSAISSDLGIPISLIDEAMSVARAHVKKFYIPKRNGAQRTILQPSKKLKTIQYWLMRNVFEELPIHESAVAYRDGVSILHNAKLHRNNRYFLKVDFKDFFTSIKWTDLQPKINKWHKASGAVWAYNREAHDLIKRSCFYINDTLPIGYPSSPIISNIAMYSFDIEMNKLIGNRQIYGDAVYTRYADDIIVSTNKSGACVHLLKEVEKLVKNNKSPKISLNRTKTKLTSSSGGTASVTGLRICAEGHITIHRKQKDHIRLLLSIFRKGSLNPDDYASLLGHLAYVNYVAPKFYSSLQKKYFKEIAEIKAIGPL